MFDHPRSDNKLLEFLSQPDHETYQNPNLNISKLGFFIFFL